MSVNVSLFALSADDLAWLEAYRPYTKTTDNRTERWFWSDHPDAYELEKAYAGVHFLLTGEDHGGDGPLAFLATGFGRQIPYEFAYGFGRVLDPATVTLIADLLESFPANVVRERLENPTLASVYPFSLRSLDDDDKEWLLAVLQGLMTYMRQVAQSGRHLLVANL